MPPHLQQAFAGPVPPDLVATLTLAAVFPDLLPRLQGLPAWAQQAFAGPIVAGIVPIPAVFPDSIPRAPGLRAADQLAYVGPITPDSGAIIPNQPPPVFPDSLARAPGLRAADQLAYAGPITAGAGLSPNLLAAVFPDAIPRAPGLRAADQLAYAGPIAAGIVPLAAVFPDRIAAKPGLRAADQLAFAGPIAIDTTAVPSPTNLASFPDQLRRAPALPTALIAAYAGPIAADKTLVELVTAPDTLRALSRGPALYQAFAGPIFTDPASTIVGALATYPNQFWPARSGLPPHLQQALVVPIPSAYTPPIGLCSIAIHQADEAAPGAVPLYAEAVIGGVAVPFDAPPTVRVHRLVVGVQVVDLATVAMTAAGGFAFTASWTAAAQGVHMVVVNGAYLGVAMQACLPISIRPKFDPIALALHDILVSRM
jgi:hypothetical protein